MPVKTSTASAQRSVLFRPLRGTAAYGQVITIAGHGSHLRFARGCVFLVGTSGELQVRDESSGESVEVPVTVIRREEVKGGREYTFRHDVDRRFVEGLPEGVRWLLEQRRVKRYKLATTVRVLVIVTGETEQIKGTLADASALGACVLLDPGCEEVLAKHESFQLAFRVGETETFHFPCEARRRELTPRGTEYGVLFDIRTEGFEEQSCKLEELLKSGSF